QPKLPAARVCADLQHGSSRNCERWSAAEIEGVGVRHEQAQPVVSAGQVEDHKVAAWRALRLGKIGEERRSCEADRERCDAVLEKFSSGHHTNWYSGDPRIRCATPADFVCSCASEPVQAAPALA